MAQEHKDDPKEHKDDLKGHTYQGQKIVSVREPKAGDLGFVAGTDQVVITFEDTTHKVVKRDEVTPPLPPAKPAAPAKP